MTRDELQTPALLVRLDHVRSNIACMMRHVGGDPRRWRPHVKTIKIPEVLDLLLDAGVRRFKCATGREARVLLERAVSPIDLLVAVAHRGANLAAIVRLAERFPRHRLSLLVEDPEHATELSQRAPAVELYVDVDPGYRRTGIPPEEAGAIEATARAAGAALRGLHGYEGHIRAPDAHHRASACRTVYDELIGVAERLRGRGIEVRELITSGTPTFRNALDHEPFGAYDHQIGAGTVVYWDTLSEAFGLRGFRPAAQVLARVIGVPRRDRVTCDAGSKSVDAAAGDPCVRVEGWPGLVAQPPSEEHLPLRVVHGPPPQAGTLLELTPAHVCPTVNLADEAVLLEHDRIVAVAAVTARGHDVVL